MIKSIDFWPRLKAENFKFSEGHVVISISDPGQRPPAIYNPLNTLRLEFYDVKDDIESLKFANGMFKEDHANAIIKLLDQYKDSPEEVDLVVHCEAGICRSAAVALFAHYYTKAPFKTLSKTSHANEYIVGLLSNIGGVDAIIPEPVISKGGILLF